MDELKKTVAKNITALRTSQHMTQFELGEMINYSDKAISRWERGEAVPDAYVLLQLAGIFGVTVDYLLADSVADADSNILDQFKQIVDGQPMERKQLALQVLRTIFAYFENGGT